MPILGEIFKIFEENQEKDFVKKREKGRRGERVTERE